MTNTLSYVECQKVTALSETALRERLDHIDGYSFCFMTFHQKGHPMSPPPRPPHYNCPYAGRCQGLIGNLLQEERCHVNGQNISINLLELFFF